MARNEMYNLQTRFGKFKDQKKLKTSIIVTTERMETLKGFNQKQCLIFWTSLNIWHDLKVFNSYNLSAIKK